MNIAVNNINYVKQSLFVHILPGVPAEGNQRPMRSRLVVDGCIVVHHPVTSNIGCQNFFTEKKIDGNDGFSRSLGWTYMLLRQLGRRLDSPGLLSGSSY